MILCDVIAEAVHLKRDHLVNGHGYCQEEAVMIGDRRPAVPAPTQVDEAVA
jgi:hypothetical protein